MGIVLTVQSSKRLGFGRSIPYFVHTVRAWSICAMSSADRRRGLYERCNSCITSPPSHSTFSISYAVHSISWRVLPSRSSSVSGCPKSISSVRASRSDTDVTLGKQVTVLCKTDEDRWPILRSGDEMVVNSASMTLSQPCICLPSQLLSTNTTVGVLPGVITPLAHG